MKFIIVFLTCFNALAACECEHILTYAREKLDETSFELTHYPCDPYLVGQFDAYADIIHQLELTKHHDR